MFVYLCRLQQWVRWGSSLPASASWYDAGQVTSVHLMYEYSGWNAKTT